MERESIRESLLTRAKAMLEEAGIQELRLILMYMERLRRLHI